MLTAVPDPASDDNDRPATGEASLIDQIVREGARRMLAQALQAEVDAYITAFIDECDEQGDRLGCPTATTNPGWCSPAPGPSR